MDGTAGLSENHNKGPRSRKGRTTKEVQLDQGHKVVTKKSWSPREEMRGKSESI